MISETLPNFLLRMTNEAVSNKNITTIIGPTPKTTFNRRDREFSANE